MRHFFKLVIYNVKQQVKIAVKNVGNRVLKKMNKVKKERAIIQVIYVDQKRQRTKN